MRASCFLFSIRRCASHTSALAKEPLENRMNGIVTVAVRRNDDEESLPLADVPSNSEEESPSGSTVHRSCSSDERRRGRISFCRRRARANDSRALGHVGRQPVRSETVHGPEARPARVRQAAEARQPFRRSDSFASRTKVRVTRRQTNRAGERHCRGRLFVGQTRRDAVLTHERQTLEIAAVSRRDEHCQLRYVRFSPFVVP